jgi:hypothetical protein
MNGSQSLEGLLDEWYRWVCLSSSDKMDDAKNSDITGYIDFMYLVEDDPETAWEAILEAIDQPRMTPYLGNLAASPLEELLDLHGASFIDRVEQRARSDAKFARVLGGVWKSAMPESIWQRVQAVWNTEGYDAPAA